MYLTRSFLIALLAVLLVPVDAPAGEYVVHSCKTPDGRPAPTDGWRTTGQTPWGTWANHCAVGGSMVANLGPQAQNANTSFIGWGFETGGAPVRGYSIWRTGAATAGGYNVSGLYYTADAESGPASARIIDYCPTAYGCQYVGSMQAGMSEANRLTRSAAQIGLGSRAWYSAVGCGSAYTGTCSPITGAGEVGSLAVHAASFRLGDDVAPSTDAPAGGLTAPGAGVGEIRFLARDDWSGVYRATIEVDGTEVVSATPNTNAGRCVRVGQAGSTNDFVHLRPCPDSQEVEMTLPAGATAAGVHQLRVRVEDAAGNRATAFGPTTINVTAAQAAGVGALATGRFVPDRPGTRTTDHGLSVRLSGTLIDRSGNPLAAANVRVEQSSSAAQRRSVLREIVTGPDGRYAISVPGSASRSVEFTHGASGASLTQKIAVRSRISLRAVHTRVKSFGRLALKGRLPGEKSRRGASAEIQVRRAGGWRTIALPRVSRTGHFRLRYRLRRTAHATFRFRAVIRPSSDLTVTPRASRTVLVKVG